MYLFTRHLEVLLDTSRDVASLDNYINNELIKRLDIVSERYFFIKIGISNIFYYLHLRAVVGLNDQILHFFI